MASRELSGGEHDVAALRSSCFYGAFSFQDFMLLYEPVFIPVYFFNLLMV